jgi:stage V sporulation protein B
MNQRQFLLKGTFLLTLTGLLTKIAGFYYKIFLSRTIGAQQIGLFQMTAPVFMLCNSIAGSGIQLAISSFTAGYFAQGRKKSAQRILVCGLALSVSLSLVCALLLWYFAPVLAVRFLLEERCAPLLKITAAALPFSVIHGCISGYFIGKKQVAPSAVSQLLEQTVRMGTVFLFYFRSLKQGSSMDASVMALGQIAGEIASALFCICALYATSHVQHSARQDSASTLCSTDALSVKRAFQSILSMALPVTLSRVLLCLLQGIEAALLPQQLQRFGLDSSAALTIYGTLTGMTLPLLLFPTAVTGSLATLLLPVVSEARSLHQDKKITDTIRAGFYSSLLLGYFFLAAFLLFGIPCGELLFHSTLAGSYICNLALLCPFLYVNSTLSSILHGLGKTTILSVCNTVSFCIRLLFVLFLVPKLGIQGYFIGLVLTQAGVTICYLLTLYQATGFSADLSQSITRPGLLCILSALPVCLLQVRGTSSLLTTLPGQIILALGYTLLFALLACRMLLPAKARTQLLAPLRHK